MENTNVLETSKPAPTRRFASLVGRIDRRTRLVALAAVAVGAALYLGWGWLAAAGFTTVIVSILPCAVMCGLGLCANRFAGNGQGKCGASSAGADSTPEPKSKP